MHRFLGRTRRSTTLYLAIASGLALAVTASCSSTEENDLPAAQTGTITRAQPSQIVQLDPQYVSDLAGFDVGSITELDRYLFLNWPTIKQAPKLTAAVQESAEREAADFRRDNPAPTADDTAVPELQRTWSVIGSSADMVGILESGVLNAGASAVQMASSTWYDATSEQVLTNADLIGDRAAFGTAVRTSLTEIDGLRDLDQVLATDGPNVVAFDADGDLIASFDEGTIAPYSMGPVEAVIPRDQAAPLLSEAGQRAQESAVNPTVFLSDATLTPGPADEPTQEATEDASDSPTEEPTEDLTEEPTAEPSQPSTTVAADAPDCAVLKCIALTFDDGPAKPTGQLLDELQETDTKATFFMLGMQVDAFPDTAKRAAEEGHEIGVHTWDHKQLTTLSSSEVSSQLDRTIDILKEDVGVTPTVMRPPYGSTNSTVGAAAERAGLAQVNWNVDPEDWKDRDAGIVTERVVKNTKRGSIILLHDIHQSSVDAVPGIVRQLKAEGYTFVTVSQLLGSPTPGRLYTSAK